MAKRIIIAIILLIVVILICYLFLRGGHKPEMLYGAFLPSSTAIKSIPYDRQFISNPRVLIKDQNISLIKNMPPPGKQLDQASCVSFAIGYYLISYYESQIANSSFYSESNNLDYARVFSPAFIFNSVNYRMRKSNCNKGFGFSYAFDFVEENGICTWLDYPYFGLKNECSSWPEDKYFIKDRAYSKYKFFKINPNADFLMNYLDAGIPIIVGIYPSKKMSENGFKYLNLGGEYNWDPSDYDRVDYHAMLCIGYNSFQKYFILLNSWGGDWGKNGTCTISFEKFFKRTRELYIVRTTSQYETCEPDYLSRMNSDDISNNFAFFPFLDDSIGNLYDYDTILQQYYDSLFSADLYDFQTSIIFDSLNISIINQLEEYVN